MKHPMPQTEQTERLTLRPVRPEDREIVQTIFGNAEVTRYYDHGQPKTPEEVAAEIERAIATRRLCGYGSWILTETDTGRAVGYGRLGNSDALGVIAFYALLPDAWGHGYATEFLRHALRLATTCFGLDRVHATVMPDNKASIKVLEKAGMRRLTFIPEWNRIVYVTTEPESSGDASP